METLIDSTAPIPLRTLLVVEDQKSVLSTLQFLFEASGYIVVPAESGAAALALLPGRTIDVALIDLHMPGMSGTEVCRRVLAHAAETHCPIRVWLMTASYSTESALKVAEAGALGLLRKPFEWPTLRETIERSLDAAPPAPLEPMAASTAAETGSAA